MYNETIYNVIIGPNVEDRLFKKRSNFTVWIWTGIIFMLFSMCFAVYDFLNSSINLDWINSLLSIGGMLYICWALYTIFYNPLRKYHISLQIYLYLLFLDYFYYHNKKYPNGLGEKMQYVIIVQTCIDSINKYTRLLEALLISGDNTITRIKYLRVLRNLLYKMKGEVFFKNQIASFRGVLDNYYSSVHIGLKAVLDFNENVEYFEDCDFDARTKECMGILQQNVASVTNGRSQEENKALDRVKRTLLVFAVSAIIIAASSLIPDKKWSIIILNISVIADVITVLLPAFDTK